MLARGSGSKPIIGFVLLQDTVSYSSNQIAEQLICIIMCYVQAQSRNNVRSSVNFC